MARMEGKGGPPGKMNAFEHRLAAIQKRREESITTGAAHASWRDARMWRSQSGVVPVP